MQTKTPEFEEVVFDMHTKKILPLCSGMYEKLIDERYHSVIRPIDMNHPLQEPIRKIKCAQCDSKNIIWLTDSTEQWYRFTCEQCGHNGGLDYESYEAYISQFPNQVFRNNND